MQSGTLHFVPRKRNLSERTREKIRVSSRSARAARKADGLCVNHHAELRRRTHGCRCFECFLVHQLSKAVAVKLLASSPTCCMFCGLRVPSDYGVTYQGVGVMHLRCAALFAALKNGAKTDVDQ